MRGHRARGLMLRLAAFVAGAALLAAGAPPAEAQRVADRFQDLVAVDAPTVALTGVRVIDGTGAPAASGRTVVIEGDRIAAVGADGEEDRKSKRPDGRDGKVRAGS